jgi:hypothetical protein
MTTHDEIEKALVVLDRLQNVHLAALIRRLRDERDEARAGWKDAELRLEDMQRPDLVRLNGHCDVHITEARNKALDEAAEAIRQKCELWGDPVSVILALKQPKP